jgi:hypothetical protein
VFSFRLSPLFVCSLAAGVAALFATACSVATPLSSPSNANSPASMVVRVGNGPASATVQVALPGYAIQANPPLHKWVVNDVFEYDVALDVQSSGAFVPLNPVVSATLLQKSGTPSSTTTFTGLAAGLYRASVTARGNNGGTAVGSALNATPATTTFDLRTVNDASASAAVTLDAVAFDATAAGAITPPTVDGAWIAPAATPASVVVP